MMNEMKLIMNLKEGLFTLNDGTLDAVLYASSTAKSGVKKSGTFYLYDGVEVNGRYRITTKSGYCGKNPIGQYVTGWVDKKDI